MAIVRITVRLSKSTTRLQAYGAIFETGMNVEIVDPKVHVGQKKYYFGTSNVKLIVSEFVRKYGSKYSKMTFDFINEHMDAEIIN